MEEPTGGWGIEKPVANTQFSINLLQAAHQQPLPQSHGRRLPPRGVARAAEQGYLGVAE